MNTEAIVRQLVYTGTAQRQGDFLLRRDGRPDAAVVEALELMLLLAPYGVEMHQPGTAPFSLTFFKIKSSKLLRYDICPVPSGREPLVCASLEGINHKYRIVVFVLNALEQREYLSVNCEYCFAVREADGYRFYKPTPDAPENPEPIKK